jgi:hypothetical protein
MRARLPNRRASLTFDFEVGGLHYTATISRVAEGRLGEIFLSNHKSNSAADINARDAAIAFSISVQHGADPEVIRRALCRDSDGKASARWAPRSTSSLPRARDGHDGHPPRLHRATPEIPA